MPKIWWNSKTPENSQQLTAHGGLSLCWTMTPQKSSRSEAKSARMVFQPRASWDLPLQSMSHQTSNPKPSIQATTQFKSVSPPCLFNISRSSSQQFWISQVLKFCFFIPAKANIHPIQLLCCIELLSSVQVPTHLLFSLQNIVWLP
jgi:hypothetical protein